MQCAACGASGLRLGSGAAVTAATVEVARRALTSDDVAAATAAVAALSTMGAPRSSVRQRAAGDAKLSADVQPRSQVPAAPGSRRGDNIRLNPGAHEFAPTTAASNAAVPLVATGATVPLHGESENTTIRCDATPTSSTNRATRDCAAPLSTATPPPQDKTRGGRGRSRGDAATPGAVHSAISSAETAAASAAGLAAAEAHKARLHAADRGSRGGAPPKVIDDRGDYFIATDSGGSTWLSPEQRVESEMAAAARAKALTVKKRGVVVTFDIDGVAAGADGSPAVRMVDVEGDRDRAAAAALRSTLGGAPAAQHGPRQEIAAHGGVPTPTQRAGERGAHIKSRQVADESRQVAVGGVRAVGGADGVSGTGALVNHTLSGRAAEVYDFIRAEAAAARTASATAKHPQSTHSATAVTLPSLESGITSNAVMRLQHDLTA